MKVMEKIVAVLASVILVPCVILVILIVGSSILGKSFKSTTDTEPIRDVAQASIQSESIPSAQTTQNEISTIKEDSIIIDTQTEFEQKENPTTDERITETQDDITSNESSGQKNALNKATQYLAYQPFSNTGLIEQLKFDDFSDEEAIYGAANCKADWSSQALKKAEQYLNYQSFSNTGLIEQLKFDGFTNEQAQYGVTNCGADWNEQALKKAEQYMNYSSFSKDGLIEQLVFDGFTNEQAQYGVNAVGY